VERGSWCVCSRHVCATLSNTRRGLRVRPNATIGLMGGKLSLGDDALHDVGGLGKTRSIPETRSVTNPAADWAALSLLHLASLTHCRFDENGSIPKRLVSNGKRAPAPYRPTGPLRTAPVSYCASGDSRQGFGLGVSAVPTVENWYPQSFAMPFAAFSNSVTGSRRGGTTARPTFFCSTDRCCTTGVTARVLCVLRVASEGRSSGGGQLH
jgi:hypothetical protein